MNESAAPQPSRARTIGVFARDLLIIVLAAVLISFLLKTFLVRSFYIPSGSMENTLITNDRIIVNELEPKLVAISRGDVVVFTDPHDWLGVPEPDTRSDFKKVTDAVLGFIGFAAPDSEDHLVKRVIGLPGDTVSCCGNFGALVVNGVPLDEPYVKLDGQTNAAPHTFDITVPDGMLWVMGDNRYESGDSLAHYEEDGVDEAIVPLEDVVGRAIVVSWPTDHWAWLDNYPATFRGTDAD